MAFSKIGAIGGILASAYSTYQLYYKDRNVAAYSNVIIYDVLMNLTNELKRIDEKSVLRWGGGLDLEILSDYPEKFTKYDRSFFENLISEKTVTTIRNYSSKYESLWQTALVVGVVVGAISLFCACSKENTPKRTLQTLPEPIVATSRGERAQRNRNRTTSTLTPEEEKAKAKETAAKEREIAKLEKERQAAQALKEKEEREERIRVEQERVRDRTR